MGAKVLVAFATKHGSTRGIAHAIGGALHASGCEVRVLPAGLVRSAEGFDAVVLGSAVYHDHWLWDGRRLLRRMRGQLDGRPTWLFSSGPIGGTLEGEEVIRTGCGPGTTAPITLAPALQGFDILGHATFAGKVDVSAGGMLERDLPRGDWRDFRQVVSWGREIGKELTVASRAQEPRPARRA